MKAYQIVLLVIVIVALNNVVLFNLPRFSTTDNQTAELSITQESQSIEVPSTAVASQNSPSISKEPQWQDQSAHSEQYRQDSLEGIDFESAFDRFLSSDKFIQALDQYRSGTVPRYQKLQSRMSQLSPEELLSVALDDSNSLEQQMAQRLLAHGDLSEINAQDLRSLYHAEGVTQWAKQKVVIRLMEEGDPQALDWAKQIITDPVGADTLGPDIYSAVYERDPDYFKDYVSTLDLNNVNKSFSALSVVSNDKELSKDFYEENFDRIVDTKSNQIFQYMFNNAEIELTNRQENRVPELFASKSSNRRRFGLSLVQSVKDVNVLRESYSQLNKNTEKLSFLRGLITRETDLEINSLIQELASDSGDQKIQDLVRRLSR